MKTMFEVWAPKATKMTLCIEGAEKTMQHCEGDFWRLEFEAVEERPLYGYKIDGQGPFPDPRSRFQPDGVHGLSQHWTDNYQWQDKKFIAIKLKDAIIYELHVGTFSEAGTFLGAVEKLDHLVSLGVTHVELLPVAAFPGEHGWGYDGVCLYAPHKNYGTPTDLKKLIDTCHQKGIAVILDVVYNHLGPDGNYLGLYGHYFSDRYHTPWGEAVNFDGPGSDQVREFVIENALYWLKEFHFDGLRLDAIHAIFDFSATHILEEMQIRVETLAQELNKDLFLVAESDLNDPKVLRTRDKGGYELASQWLDDFHHSLHVMFTNEQSGYYQSFKGADNLDKCLNENFVYSGSYSPCHQRRHGKPAKDLAAEKFIVSLQNHDQIGNRAFGERLCHLISFDECQIAATFFLLSPFVPMLFQGEEWAASSAFMYFTDHTDETLAQAIREGRQKMFSDIHKALPNPQASETFFSSKLKWTELGAESHDKMLSWHRELIKTRKENLGQLRNQRPHFSILDKIKRFYSYKAGNLEVIANCGSEVLAVDKKRIAKASIVLQNKEVEQNAGRILLKPSTVIVLKGE